MRKSIQGDLGTTIDWRQWGCLSPTQRWRFGRLHESSCLLLLLGIVWHCLVLPHTIRGPETLNRLWESGPLHGINKAVQRSWQFHETLERLLLITLAQEATTGFEPVMGVLQTLARLFPHSVQGSWICPLPS
jgi:hypothetical protein